MLRDITTIELKRTTKDILDTLNVKQNESYDSIICRLISTNVEVEKYIKQYIESANGKCITQVMFNRVIIANHEFEGDKCKKCGIPAPIKPYRLNDETIISVGHGDNNE